MEDESIQKDEEKLKSLLETLKKNDENVPEELLKTCLLYTSDAADEL